MSKDEYLNQALEYLKNERANIKKITWKNTRDYKQARYMALSEIEWILKGGGDPLEICQKCEDMYVSSCRCVGEIDVFKLGD